MRQVNAFRAIYKDKSGMPEEAVARVSRSVVGQRLKRERSMPLATYGGSKPNSVRAGQTNPTPVFLRRTNWRPSPTLKINLPPARPKPSGSAGAALCSRGHLNDTISQRRTDPPTSPTGFGRKAPDSRRTSRHSGDPARTTHAKFVDAFAPVGRLRLHCRRK